MLKRNYRRLLSRHTSLRIGGPAFCWLEPEGFDDILEAISLAGLDNRSLTVIGNGTNLLAQDKGFDGLIMNLGGKFDSIEKETNEIVMVGAATPIAQLVNRCAEFGLSGCEFLSGIPGSFGGSVFMNAGVRDIGNPGACREIKDIIVDVDVVDLKDKTRKNIKADEIGFRYRSSGLDGKCILGARIRLEKEATSVINGRIDSFMKTRQWIQKLSFPSAGSVFKNPDASTPAGKLIDECGLKGAQAGGAEISRVHANFIVNTGNAMAKDVLELIRLAKGAVKGRFDIDLELELKII
ncbi:UDP-N-acetylmuramate dehydrogenase [Candidatus Omnitrophota bacterium]